jgi:hypothetical protein
VRERATPRVKVSVAARSSLCFGLADLRSVDAGGFVVLARLCVAVDDVTAFALDLTRCMCERATP